MTRIPTSNRIPIPRSMVERKPKHGDPCTHCGVCCAGSLCQLGQAVFDRPFVPGPCPALMLDPVGRSVCMVTLDPRAFNLSAPVSDDELVETALILIGSGYGCDARINGEPVNAEFNARLDQWDLEMESRINDAKRIWGVRVGPPD